MKIVDGVPSQVWFWYCPNCTMKNFELEEHETYLCRAGDCGLEFTRVMKIYDFDNEPLDKIMEYFYKLSMMKSSETKKGDIVGYYGSENRRGSSNLRFAKILSFGKVYATVILEDGNRARIGLWKLHHAPEGREYFAPSNTAYSRESCSNESSNKVLTAQSKMLCYNIEAGLE